MDEKDSELVVLWFLTGSAVAIMLLRLSLAKYRHQRIEIGGYLTIAAIVSILLRATMEHVALVWGTNNVHSAAALAKLTPEDIYHREVGSKMTIVNRVFYTVYTWIQKCVVMCLIQRLVQGLRKGFIVKTYWVTLAITFAVSLAVTFVDCHPFRLYWQVVPDPGSCSSGTIQLIVFSALNMATDLMLIILPLPLLIRIQRPLMDKIRLVVLFLVGFSIVAVTLTRLLLNVVLLHRAGQSHNVANVEIFFSAFVANAPTIYGLLGIEEKARQRSRSRYYAGAGSRGYNTSSKSTPIAEARYVGMDLESTEMASLRAEATKMPMSRAYAGWER